MGQLAGKYHSTQWMLRRLNPEDGNETTQGRNALRRRPKKPVKPEIPRITSHRAI